MALIGWHTQVAERSRSEDPPMSLRVMILVGCCVLVLGLTMLWLAPATTSHPRAVKPIDSSILSHEANPSAGQLRSRTDRQDTIDSREK
jgi:hypothetical protein